MGKKGGETTSKVELDPAMQAQGEKALDLTNLIAQLGFVANPGLQVAALAPQQVDAMRNANNAASAFGMASSGNGLRALTGLPQPEKEGGFFGYRPFDPYSAAVGAIPESQRSFIDSLFINPQTGAAPSWAGCGRDQTKHHHLKTAAQ